MKYTFRIEGVDCATCAQKLEREIQHMNDVTQASINFATQMLQVQSHKDVQEKEFITALQATIDSVEKGITLVSQNSRIEKPKLFTVKQNGTLIIGLILLVFAILVENHSYSFLLFLASYIVSGHKVLVKAFKNSIRLDMFDENFLMCIATIGALYIGEYTEAVAVMIFYAIGEVFQSYAVNKTRSSISSLMDIKSDYANVVIDNTVIQRAPEEVQVEDIILVKVGEKIPVDGIVIKGSSTLDTSSLTGESLPRVVEVDNEVLAGVINLTGIIYIKVTRPYADSSVSKIIELMENAANKKAPIEHFITKFAKVYTPIVVLLAIIMAVVPMLILEDAMFSDWLYRALTFLVVSCPCALVISVPLGLYAGLGKASKIGVLIKGGNYLELLKDVNTIAFDKTGTLTHGNFEVIEINGSDDVLPYGAYGEYLSNHPIGKAIVEAYKKDIDTTKIKDFEEIAGNGISVTINHKPVHLGNQKYLETKGISVVEPHAVGTIVHVAIENKYAGNIVVADKIKDSSIRGMKRLQKVGVKNTVMLTGDHYVVAKNIAERLGINKVYSQLLPEEKVQQMESLLQDPGCIVAFVGDGINDAPVLARADIGIAMGGIGSDAAIEAADVVLMDDNIERIGEAIKISKKTNAILKQNIIFILTIKIGVLLLTMFGYADMWMGVLADVGVTLLTILNSIRIIK